MVPVEFTPEYIEANSPPEEKLTAPFQDAKAPYTVNTMYIMDDMTSHYGGTLVVPGSHRLISAAGAGNPITEPLPPAINLAAPAGTVMMFEGLSGF